MIEHKIDESALNAAGWEFIKTWPKYTKEELPPRAFNNIKPMIRAAIEEYIRLINIDKGCASI